MRKVIIVLLLEILILTGCSEKKLENADYGIYSFTDVSWIRDDISDTETIIFKSDGSFGYSCACGNPINDADLCDSYTYDEENKEIKLICSEITKEMVTNINIINLTDTTLELDFDGEIRKFNKEK